MRTAFLLSAAVAAGVLSGCGSGTSSQPAFPELLPVTGIVTQGGKAVSGGNVRFTPEPARSGFMYTAEVGYLAKKYNDPELLNEFNVAGFMRDSSETLYQGLILAFKPVNMDVLPLYIVLMLAFPPVVWALLRKPNLTLFASFVLYLSARHFGWNLAAYPAAPGTSIRSPDDQLGGAASCP